MTTGMSCRGRLFVWLIALMSVLPQWAAAQELDIHYAEILPLADESLLLDIVQTPSGRLVAVGERGHVLLSQDGDDWVQADVVPTRSTLTSVESVEGRLWAGGHDTAIITSGDNGKTWSLQYFDPERRQPILDIHFDDSLEGTVMGAYGLFLTTENGGANWEDGLVDPEVEYHLNSMIVMGDNRFIAGEAGYSYRSLDGGETWEPLDLPYIGSMWGAVSKDGCAIFFGLRGHVLESCDNGDSWEEIPSGTLASLSAGVVDGERLVLVGNSGTILIRRGNGPFEVVIHSSGVDFSSILAVSGGNYLLVGEDGIHHFPEKISDQNDDSGEGDS